MLITFQKGFLHFLNNVFNWIFLAVLLILPLIFDPSDAFILNLSLLLCCILTLIFDITFQTPLNTVSKGFIYLITSAYQCLFITSFYVLFIPVFIKIIGSLLIIGIAFL